tara:strand:- start:204 stop:620 length:417 start_codon:yes stop_codon:yes gene_type:complete
MGRILGVDYGDSRIGLALSDSTKMIASPFCTIPNKGSQWLLKQFEQIIKEKKIECFVIGLPVSLSGKDTTQTKKVRLFAKVITHFNIPIYLQDERLSSVSASKALIKQKIKTGHNKNLIDDTAAAIFLQQYLDTNYQR